MKKDYDIICSVGAAGRASIEARIREYAQAGWRVHTFTFTSNPLHVDDDMWVALMERDTEE